MIYFCNHTATTEIYTLSLHDALPIYHAGTCYRWSRRILSRLLKRSVRFITVRGSRSEEHTSELQSLAYLVCRLLLEKKKCQVKLPERPRVGLHHSVAERCIVLPYCTE